MEVTAGVTMSLRLLSQTQQSLLMILLEIHFCWNTLLKQNMILIHTHKNDNIFWFPIRQCLRLHYKTGSEGNPQYSLGKNHDRVCVDGGEVTTPGLPSQALPPTTCGFGKRRSLCASFCHL